MSNHFCKTCGGYLWKFGKHTCPPAWNCRIDNEWKDDHDWHEVRASDAEHAAEKFAEEYDCNSGEYSILRAGDRCEEVIEVRATDGSITRWNIRAESLPHYYAEEAE